MGHTEWRRDGTFVISGLGDIPCTARTKAIANRIVRDHNTLPNLVEALEGVKKYQDGEWSNEGHCDYCGNTPAIDHDEDCPQLLAQDALTLAKEGT